MADIQPPEGQNNVGAGTLILNPVEPLTGVGSKRQRRPSVRLGDIGGDPLHDSHSRKHFNNPSGIIKPSKTRPLTNLDDRDPNTNFKLKKRASTKRLRSNWVSRFDGDDKHSAAEDFDDGYREFHLESPIHSMDNLGVDGLLLHRGSSSFKGRDHHDGVELSGPSDTDARDWKCGDENDGVRVWLDGLGLGRYAPVFQVHEVDDEVLPMLTLEDLKDMGITAVGTRRKMYCAIQKLGKGFS